MSIKSTIELTREQAEEKFIEIRLQDTIKELKNILKCLYKKNEKLENMLQEEDEKNGNNFTNYRIIEKEV